MRLKQWFCRHRLTETVTWLVGGKHGYVERQTTCSDCGKNVTAYQDRIADDYHETVKLLDYAKQMPEGERRQLTRPPF